MRNQDHIFFMIMPVGSIAQAELCTQCKRSKPKRPPPFIEKIQYVSLFSMLGIVGLMMVGSARKGAVYKQNRQSETYTIRFTYFTTRTVFPLIALWTLNRRLDD